MQTHEVAEQAGVNAQTLRYYERRGLLAEPPRSQSGYRDYPTSAVDVLRFVKRAQELGFSLAESHMAELDRRIADLHRMRASLDVLVATCERPRVDRSCPLLDAIESREPLTEVPR